VIEMAHEKLKSLAVCIMIFAIVGSVSWALVNAETSHRHQIQPQPMPKLTSQTQSSHTNLEFVENQLRTKESPDRSN